MEIETNHDSSTNNQSNNIVLDSYEMNYVGTERIEELEVTTSIEHEVSSSPENNREVVILSSRKEIEKDKSKLFKSEEKINNGSMICCFYFRNDPLIAIGPNYVYFIIFTLILFSLHTSIFFFIDNGLNKIFKYIGHTLYFLQIFLYTLTTLKNPGIPSNNNRLLAKNEKFMKNSKNKVFSHCSICNSYTAVDSEEITFHCPDCDVCIEGYDHHCVWTSKCVGKANLKIFYCFAIITPIYILFVLVAIISNFV
jgi:hypothetical protein